MDEFMKDDGRHVHPRAVDYIIQQFLRTFACDDLGIAETDASGLAAPGRAASQGGRVLSFPARITSGLFRRLKPDWTRRRAG
jgi:hypothetical protein